MQVTIGTVNADPRVLDKSTLMTNTRTVDVQIWKTCDVKKPTFLLDVRAENVHANYCFVDDWNAYYYLSEPVIMDGNRCTVSGILDPLTTYAGDIKELSGYLVRTADSNKSNKFIRDNQKQTQANARERIYQFNRSPFSANFATDIVYLLTVIGGKHT